MSDRFSGFKWKSVFIEVKVCVETLINFQCRLFSMEFWNHLTYCVSASFCCSKLFEFIFFLKFFGNEIGQLTAFRRKFDAFAHTPTVVVSVKTKIPKNSFPFPCCNLGYWHFSVAFEIHFESSAPILGSRAYVFLWMSNNHHQEYTQSFALRWKCGSTRRFVIAVLRNTDLDL